VVSGVIPLTLKGLFPSFQMYPAIYLALISSLLGFHFIYKGIISQKILVVLLLMFFFMIAGYYKHFF
jgi:hypothetical protein